MPLFFIEMGQGVVAKGDLRVKTSPLYSCSLIAGFNTKSKYGGAYHYPSGQLTADAEVKAEMEVWIKVLNPTAVKLIFARAGLMGMNGTQSSDKAALRNWVAQQCGFQATTGEAVAAGMGLRGGNAMEAGSINTLQGDYQTGAIDLRNYSSGTYDQYGRFTLVGKNREDQD